MLTTGQMETLNDSFSGTISDDNVVRELVKAGKTWKAYAESLPSPGYLGRRFRRYTSGVTTHLHIYRTCKTISAQAANIVPFTQFATDLANNALPQYSFIVPNVT